MLIMHNHVSVFRVLTMSVCILGSLVFLIYLRINMTMVVMTAAKKTKPPKTPSAIMPPTNKGQNQQPYL